MIKLKLSTCFLFLSICNLSHAATITVGPGQTYTTITAGVAAMSEGDTLIIKNGTYDQKLTGIPNGSSGKYTIIKAENDGGVIITGGLTLPYTNSYIQVEGIKFTKNIDKIIYGNHLKFFRCAFEGGGTSGNTATVDIGDSDHNATAYILLEDCWTYGTGGRYNVSIFNADHIILRRVVNRHDGGWTDSKGDPEAAVAVYNSNYVELQNVVTLDSNLTYKEWQRAYYTIYNPNSPGAGGVVHPTNNVNWTGSIALNNDGACFESDGGSGADIVSNYYDIACIKSFDGGFSGGSSGGKTIPTITRGTFVDPANKGTWDDGFAKWDSGTMNVSNTIISGFNGTALGTGTSATYSNLYGNGSNGTCTNCKTLAPKTNGLLYPVRIEDGSALKTAGSNGGQVGATILKKIGVSGTLWGDTGYNTVTTENLWPWPNENRIKSDMANVSARGFTTGNSIDGSPQTLTKYIWESLGAAIPSEIYSTSSQPPAPIINNITTK